MLLDLYPQRAYAPSGMRRLMMYMLQEESLRKDEEKKRFSDAAKEAAEITVAPQKPKKLQKKLKRFEPEVTLEPIEIPKFKRKAIHTVPTQVHENLPVWLSLVSMEIDMWFQQLIPFWDQHKAAIIVKQEAANDADYRLRLLLLAA